MQKIRLSRETMGLLKDRLSKLTEGVYTSENSKVFNPSNCQGISWGNKVTRSISKISIHWYAKGDSSHSQEEELPLLHIWIDACTARCYNEGSVFYFIGTNTVVIARNDSFLNTRLPNSAFEKITRVCKRRDMSLHQVIAEYQRKDHEQRYDDHYRRREEEGGQWPEGFEDDVDTDDLLYDKFF